MGISELRERNNIAAPTTSPESTWNKHVSSRQSPGNTQEVGGADDNPIADIHTQSEKAPYRDAEHNDAGTGPGFFGQNPYIADDEMRNRRQEDSRTYTRTIYEDTQHEETRQHTEKSPSEGSQPGTFGRSSHENSPSYTPPIHSDTGRLSEFFRNLPYLWQVDAVCILLTVAGVTAIIMNLPSVLAFIFGILYSIISFLFAFVFYIALFAGAILLLFRRRRR